MHRRGSEGLNLQFCNTVINYDLPWNPMKIEQRIGRCHRYGQQNDVVAINLLNTQNEADKRVYEILLRSSNCSRVCSEPPTLQSELWNPVRASRRRCWTSISDATQLLNSRKSSTS